MVAVLYSLLARCICCKKFIKGHAMKVHDFFCFLIFQGYGFRVVYRGIENYCVIEKLQRNTFYKFRVSAVK